MTDFMTYKEAISYDELYKSMMKCKRNVQWKDSTSNFVLHSVKQISKLSSELQNETYIQGEPYLFRVTVPKSRDILSMPFRDRVYQRSLNDNILYPVMTKSFILDNCACQHKKGNQFARQRLVAQLRRMVNKYGANFYILQIDIHGFYKNLPHDYINKLFQEKLDQETYVHVLSILKTQYQGNKGYNPGSQMIQIAGIAALNKLDHYIKEQLHVKIYEHYMDDLIVGFQTREEAIQGEIAIEGELFKIGLEFNRKKTRIYPVSNGIPFLGFVFTVTKTGKILEFPLSEKIKNAKRKYKHMIQYSLPHGNISVECIEESYRDFRSCISEGNSYYCVQKMDKYYLSLWKGDKKYEQREIKYITDLRKAKKRSTRCQN